MGLYVGTSEPKSIYLGTTAVKEVYLGTTKVRPSKRRPTSNTVAYRPLTTNLTDTISGTNLTYSSPATVTKQTLGYRVKGGLFAGYYSNVVLMSMWIKVISGTSPYCGLGGIANPSIGYYYKHAESRLNQKFFCWTNSSFGASTTSATIGTGTWHHIVYCYDSSANKTYGYLDGVQYVVYNGAGYSFGNDIFLIGSQSSSSNTNFSGNFTVDVSEVIFESVARTSQEVADYYNNTKTNYGL